MIYDNPKTWFPEKNPQDLSNETFEIVPNKVLTGISRRRCTIVPYSFVKEAMEIIATQWDLDIKNTQHFRVARHIMINSVINN